MLEKNPLHNIQGLTNVTKKANEIGQLCNPVKFQLDFSPEQSVTYNTSL
jgi:hypothetical protein